MKPVPFATIAGSSVLLAGCSIFCPTCPDPVATPPAGAPVAAAGQCLLGNTKASTCIQGTSPLVCPVYVYSTPNGGVVYPHTLVVPRNQAAVVVWELIEPGARFGTTDGPLELKNNPQEFENAKPTEALDGAISAPSVASAKRYRIDYKNVQQGQKHKYTIQFRTRTGIEVKCDPFITNESG